MTLSTLNLFRAFDKFETESEYIGGKQQTKLLQLNSPLNVTCLLTQMVVVIFCKKRWNKGYFATNLADSNFFIRCAVFSLAFMNNGRFLFSSTSCKKENRHLPTMEQRTDKRQNCLEDTVLTKLWQQKHDILQLQCLTERSLAHRIFDLLLHLRDVANQLAVLLLLLVDLVLDLRLLAHLLLKRLVLALQLGSKLVDFTLVVVELEHL